MDLFFSISRCATRYYREYHVMVHYGTNVVTMRVSCFYIVCFRVVRSGGAAGRNGSRG